MAAAKPKAYRVSAAAAVIRKEKAERYLYRGAIIPADTIDEDNAKHLLAQGLIESFDPDAGSAAAAKKAAADKAAADAAAGQGAAQK